MASKLPHSRITLLSAVLLTIFALNGISYAVGGPSVGVAVVGTGSVSFTDWIRSWLWGDKPGDSIDDGSLPANTAWRTDLYASTKYGVLGNAWEICRKIGESTLCVRLTHSNAAIWANIQDVFAHQTIQYVTILAVDQDKLDQISYAGWNQAYSSGFVGPNVEAYISSPECGGVCKSGFPAVPSNGPNWPRYEFWRVMTEELKGELLPYAAYASLPKTAITSSWCATASNCPISDFEESRQKALARWPSWEVARADSLWPGSAAWMESFYGVTSTITNGVEGEGGTTILTVTNPTKDAAINSCSGVWLPFYAQFGCQQLHRNYRTVIRTGTDTLVDVATDPVGVGAEILVAPDDPAKGKVIVAVGGTFIGNPSACAVPFGADGLLTCSIFDYTGWHYEVRTRTYPAVDESIVYQELMMDYTKDAGSGTAQIITYPAQRDVYYYSLIPSADDWKRVTDYMATLSLIDKLIFVSWWNAYSHCWSGSTDQNACWKNGVKPELFDGYAKNGNLSILQNTPSGNLLTGAKSATAAVFPGMVSPVCQYLTLKSIASKRSVGAYPPMIPDATACTGRAAGGIVDAIDEESGAHETRWVQDETLQQALMKDSRWGDAAAASVFNSIWGVNLDDSPHATFAGGYAQTLANAIRFNTATNGYLGYSDVRTTQDPAQSIFAHRLVTYYMENYCTGDGSKCYFGEYGWVDNNTFWAETKAKCLASASGSYETRQCDLAWKDPREVAEENTLTELQIERFLAESYLADMVGGTAFLGSTTGKTTQQIIDDVRKRWTDYCNMKDCTAMLGKATGIDPTVLASKWATAQWAAAIDMAMMGYYSGMTSEKMATLGYTETTIQQHIASTCKAIFDAAQGGNDRGLCGVWQKELLDERNLSPVSARDAEAKRYYDYMCSNYGDCDSEGETKWRQGVGELEAAQQDWYSENNPYLASCPSNRECDVYIENEYGITYENPDYVGFALLGSSLAYQNMRYSEWTLVIDGTYYYHLCTLEGYCRVYWIETPTDHSLSFIGNYFKYDASYRSLSAPSQLANIPILGTSGTLIIADAWLLIVAFAVCLLVFNWRRKRKESL